MDSQEQAGTPWRAILVVWLVLIVMIAIGNAAFLIEWRYPDPDDELRLVQVRDLLAGQGWFDLHQYRIDPGNSPVMHWSRIVDAPLALMIGLLSPLLGQPAAEVVTVIAVPLLLLLGVLLAIGWTANRLLGREVAIFACLVLGLYPMLTFQLQPMRIDHHGWQLLCAAVAIAAMCFSRPVRGGLMAGVAMGVGLLVSLELLPLAAVFGAVFALRWIIEPREKMWLTAYLGGIAVSLLVLFAFTRGFSDLTQYCDAISPAHLVLFAAVALGVGAVAASRIRSPVLTALAIGAAGVLGLALYLWQSPECSSGPFAALDPLVRTFWYDKVPEGMPIWHQPTDMALTVLVQCLIAVLAVYVLWRRNGGNQRRIWAEWGLVMLGSALTGLFVLRSMAFVSLFSTVPIGWLATRLLARFREANGVPGKLFAAAVLLLVLFPGAPFSLARTALPKNQLGELNMATRGNSSCDIATNAVSIRQLPNGTIFAPLDISPAILRLTGQSVIATGHHRAQAEIHDVIKAYLSSADVAHTIVTAHHADYMVVCTDLIEPRLYREEAPGGLMADIVAGEAPDWLQPIDLGTPESFKVYRVRP